MTAPWQEVEIELTATTTYDAPYTDVDVWADFTSGDDVLRRPAFWDGGDRWRLRFAAPYAGDWDWVSSATSDDSGLAGRSGTVTCLEDRAEGRGRLYTRGFWRMSPWVASSCTRGRHAGSCSSPTRRGLPWRATPEQVREYAAGPTGQGVQRVLLMPVQPDMRAVGPRGPAPGTKGFAGRLRRPPRRPTSADDPDYFQPPRRTAETSSCSRHRPGSAARLPGVRLEEGLDVAGTVSPSKYAALLPLTSWRGTARASVYRVGAHGKGGDEATDRGGRWRRLGTPVDRVPASRPASTHPAPPSGRPLTRTPTGSTSRAARRGTGEHLAERVADMWRNNPAKAVANAEPDLRDHHRPDRGGGGLGGRFRTRPGATSARGRHHGRRVRRGQPLAVAAASDEPGHGTTSLPRRRLREAVGFEGSSVRRTGRPHPGRSPVR